MSQKLYSFGGRIIGGVCPTPIACEASPNGLVYRSVECSLDLPFYSAPPGFAAMKYFNGSCYSSSPLFGEMFKRGVCIPDFYSTNATFVTGVSSASSFVERAVYAVSNCTGNVSELETLTGGCYPDPRNNSTSVEATIASPDVPVTDYVRVKYFSGPGCTGTLLVDKAEACDLNCPCHPVGCADAGFGNSYSMECSLPEASATSGIPAQWVRTHSGDNFNRCIRLDGSMYVNPAECVPASYVDGTYSANETARVICDSEGHYIIRYPSENCTGPELCPSEQVVEISADGEKTKIKEKEMTKTNRSMP
jgi:hypothetical protein